MGQLLQRGGLRHADDLPWKLYIPPSNRPVEYAQSDFFHPTFLYESLWDLLVFIVLVRVFRDRVARAPGALFLTYLGLYSVGRFFTEGLRTDALMAGSVRVAQLVSVVGVVVAIVVVPLPGETIPRRVAVDRRARLFDAMTHYASRDGRLRLFRGDSRRLDAIASGSVGVILTSPPYWIRGRGRASAERYARELATGFGPEWRRVLAPDGDLWLVIGDRHDGTEWVGLDALLTPGSGEAVGGSSRRACGLRRVRGSAGTTG